LDYAGDSEVVNLTFCEPSDPFTVLFHMTFREIHQFTEILRMLGCPLPLGNDSFDVPNFALMAQLLQFLVTLYDPDIVLMPDLSFEAGRVEFIRSTVQQMAVRSGIRLNPRKLYASDRYAVRELLKLAGPIYQGVSSLPVAEHKDGSPKKLPSLQRIAQLSMSVPRQAVALFDQLGSELDIREPRSKILSTMPPLDEVEKAVREAVESATIRLDTLTKEVDRLNNDEDSLQTKIKQRRHELDRQEKRLIAVQTLRPAHLDEYESLESELNELFRIHCQHYRNVDYYEHELQEAQERQAELQSGQKKRLGKWRVRVNRSIIGDIEKSYQTTVPIPALDPAVPPIDGDEPEDEDDLSNLDAGPAQNSDDSF
jgi:clusterin-associated protein 1